MSDSRRTEDKDLLELAGEILDGRPVDWTAAPDTAGGYAADLRAIESLARLGALGLGTWGHLRLLERVASGAFGDVYRAWDTRLDREVALKLLDARRLTGEPATAAVAEARMLARVRHPNVVTVFGAETIDGRTGIWTEFVHGVTLAEIVANRVPLPVAEVVSIGIDLCRALGAVHQAGVIHGDVKAHNVLREEGGRIVLVDLGTGRERMRDAALTSDGRLSGTPLYIAPELWRGDAPTPQSDIYSLGVLLYHLLTGTYPVRGATTDEVRDAHAAGRRVVLSDERRDLPASIVIAIEQALSGNPRSRFANADTLATALQRADPAVRRRRRQRVIVQTTVAVMIAAAIVVTWRIARDRDGRQSSSHPAATPLTFLPPNHIVSVATAISPDGDRCAYGTQAGVYIQLISTREPYLALPADREREILDLAWLPDSTALLIAASDGLWRVSAMPGGPTPSRITVTTGLIAVSPMNGRIALTESNRRILVLGIDGHAPLEVVAAHDGVQLFKPSWSPRGDRFSFAQFSADGMAVSKAIMSVRWDGAARTTVMPVTGVSSHVWAPDGRILFSAQRRSANGIWAELYAIAMDLNTGLARGRPTLLIADQNLNIHKPSLTADGKRLVFTLQRERRQVQMADFDSNTMTVANLHQASSTSSLDEGLAWLPSGDAILFKSTAEAGSAIYRQSLGSAEPRRVVAESAADIEQAVPSPDGRWILFGRDAQLLRQPSDGGPATSVFDFALRRAWTRCASRPSTVCAVGAQPSSDDLMVLISFDPDTGVPRHHPSLRTWPAGWDLSRDGTRVVAIDATKGSQQLLVRDLRNDQVRLIATPAAEGASSVTWMPDDKGWIVTRRAGAGGQVCHVDSEGRSTTIWKSDFEELLRPLISPDGRRIAFTRRVFESNVWVLEHF